MARRTGILALIAAGLSLALPGCRRANPQANQPIKVVVTVAPLKGIIEPLLPSQSTVTILMQPGRSEHGYEFTPSDIAQLAAADIVVYVGLGLEGKLEDVLAKQDLPTRQVVNFADAVGIRADEHDHTDHSDHADHEHQHAVDPHLWLNPVLVDALIPALAQAVLKAEEARGRESAAVLKRLDAAALELRRRIDGVDKAWGEGLMPLRGQAVVTHHNAFSRPAERYGFKIAAVIKQFEDEPTPGDIARVVEAIRAEGVRAIFVEPQYHPASAQKIAETAGVQVGTLDPLGDGDWFGLMQKNLDSLLKHLGGGAAAPAASHPPTELK